MVALLLLAGWLLVRIGWTAWDLATLETPEPLVSRSTGIARNDAAGVPGSGLFGTPAQWSNTSGAPGILREGNFRLTGVVASSNSKMAHAIIETGGISEAYFLGDTVAAGISLQDVRPNEVLLRRGGEILRLPLSEMRRGAGEAASGNRRLSTANTAGFGGELLAPPRMSLSQLIDMQPVMHADGRMQGYRISPRARRAWFDSHGLVSGDLLVAINGVPFDPDNLAQAGQEMSSGGDMMLSIVRDGEPLEITVGSENFGLLAM